MTHRQRTKGSPLRILLADTDRRAYAARLAMAFVALGCDVAIVCTKRHPIENVRAPHRTFHYSGLRPLASLLQAIKSADPDLILPCDDRPVQHLHQLCREVRTRSGSGGPLVELIERSLGPSVSHPIVSSRYTFLQLARAEGIQIPATDLVREPEALSEMWARQPFPWVLKADGTWGGGGVRLVRNPPEAWSAFQFLQRPCGLTRAVKRALVNRDTFYLRDWWQACDRAVIAQTFVPGRPANCAAASWEGRVLAQLSVEVLVTSNPTGPAKVVRVIDNPGMAKASERIASSLHISGCFGLDFILEAGTNALYLLEMNPRCTPLCHIQMDKEPSLVAALHSCLAGRPRTSDPLAATRRGQVISYYPPVSNPNRDFHDIDFQDLPHGEPELAQALLRPFPQATILYRVVDYLSRSNSDKDKPA
jgi:hypothetical protein